MRHVPVLLKEVLEVIAPKDRGRYFDGTVGAGSHARAILEKSSPGGLLAGTDLDDGAIKEARKTLSSYKGRFFLFNSCYTEIVSICQSLGWEELDGILVDLGLSSMLLEDGPRGFSFRTEGPLDMRYSSKEALSAYEVVNKYPRERLVSILRDYGEERFANRIAGAIVSRRPLNTTKQLAEIVSMAIPRRYWPKRIHPATRTFQAIRIEVNKELDKLKEFLDIAPGLLSHNGIIAVISFHSMEDRIVKQSFKDRNHPSGVTLKPVSNKPIRPSEMELSQNPRARSARLRAARRIN